MNRSEENGIEGQSIKGSLLSHSHDKYRSMSYIIITGSAQFERLPNLLIVFNNGISFIEQHQYAYGIYPQGRPIAAGS